MIIYAVGYNYNKDDILVAKLITEDFYIFTKL